MRNARVRPARDFDSTQITVVAKPLRRRADNGALSGRARRDKRAVDVPKKKAVFSLCHSERSRGISRYNNRCINREIPRLRSE